MREVLVIILGGGQGSRLYPLTQLRSKPAVPIGGKYRLIDVPISNCLHVGLRRIFVLTQFNSASLNRHIAQTYRLDLFSEGFVEILAAEQTPESTKWFQGTADAVRRASRHFHEYAADYYLILAGDHLYRMDFSEMIEAHIESQADITIAAQPVTPADAPAMGIFRFDPDGRIVAFEEKPNADRLGEIGSSIPPDSRSMQADAAKPFVASMGIYVFSREVLFEVLRGSLHVDFGREIIPAALSTHRVRPYLFDGYWADVGTIGSFYDAHMMLTRPDPPFSFYDPARPIYSHARFLPPSRLNHATIVSSLVAEGCYLDGASVTDSVVGVRTAIGEGAKITRSVLLGADHYESDRERRRSGDAPPIGVGRGTVLDRVLVDKNARIGDHVTLVNEQGVDEMDGDGFYVRDGIVIVPKHGVVKPGTRF
ncbi:MAG: glucose-1-phosphate adenylyltransferase [Vicinamibacteraceae bacterium]|nr:glucose-1-phosphate adenylyltransferase [Vicinamibacteraceae bacterium]